MPTIETFYYHGTLYTWHHEPQNLYQARHITIYDAIQVITHNDSVVSSQCVGGEERYKHIGLSPAGIIAVITDRDKDNQGVADFATYSGESIRGKQGSKGKEAHLIGKEIPGIHFLYD